MEIETSSSSEEVPVPNKRRKEWLRSGCRVPRSTLRRWREQRLSESSGTSDDDDIPAVQFQDVDVNAEVQQPVPVVDPLLAGGEGTSQGTSASSTSTDSDSDEESIDNSDSEYSSDDNREDEIFLGARPELFPEPLYEASTTSKGKAIVLLMEIYSKYAMTKVCLKAIIRLIYNLLPVNNTFPRSLHMLKNCLTPFTPPDCTVPHWNCEQCGMYIQEVNNGEVCPVCTSKKKVVYHELKLSTQIKYLFEHRDLADAIDGFQVGANNDTASSEEYRAIKRFFPGQYDVFLIWNVDGVRPHKSGKGEIYPTIATVCNVAPQLRHSYTIVTGLWFHTKAPQMNSYLLPFARSLVELAENGLEWIHPRTGQRHVSKVVAPVVTLDAPARAKVQNLHQYNGEYSCNMCEIPGLQIRLGERSSKRVFPFPEDANPLRSKDSMEAMAARAIAENVIVRGVKGSSILSGIPYCDPAKSIILDYMHLVLLGVVRQFFELWFGTSRTDWYIGNRKATITAYLKKVKGMKGMTRMPTDVSAWKRFKASTWRIWLLFVSVPALHGKLKDKYFQHWLLLVLGIYILLQAVVSDEELQLAEQLLSLFVRDTEDLYTLKAMTYNVHGLLHLVMIVRRWGALWATSAFKFENVNGILTRLLHGTTRVSTELCNTLSLITSSETFKFHLNNGVPLVQDIPQNKLLSPCEFPLRDVEREILAAECGDPRRLLYFARARIRRNIYTSSVYSAEKAMNNKTICFNSNNTKEYGVVKFYVRNGEEDLAFIRCYRSLPDLFFRHNEINVTLRHIIPFETTNTFVLVPICQIELKVLKVHNFLCLEPNNYEKVL